MVKLLNKSLILKREYADDEYSNFRGQAYTTSWCATERPYLCNKQTKRLGNFSKAPLSVKLSVSTTPHRGYVKAVRKSTPLTQQWDSGFVINDTNVEVSCSIVDYFLGSASCNDKPITLYFKIENADEIIVPKKVKIKPIKSIILPKNDGTFFYSRNNTAALCVDGVTAKLGKTPSAIKVELFDKPVKNSGSIEYINPNKDYTGYVCIDGKPRAITEGTKLLFFGAYGDSFKGYYTLTEVKV